MLSISGCGDSVNVVKTSRMNFNTQYTVDEAFSNRKICMDVTWETITDSRQRELVQYKCKIIGVKEFYETQKESHKEQITKVFESELGYANRDLEYAKQYLAQAELNIKKEPETDSTLSEYQSTRERNLKQAKKILNEGNPGEISRLGDEFLDMEILEISRALSIQSWMEMIHDENHTQKEEFKNYYISPESRDQYFEMKDILKKSIPQALVKVEAAILQEEQRKSQEHEKSLTYAKNRAKQELEQSKADYSAAKVAHEEKTAKLKEALDERLKEIDRSPELQIESASEIYQWIINGEEIELVWGGIEKTHKDGKTTRSMYYNFNSRPDIYLKDVYQDHIETYSQLRI